MILTRRFGRALASVFLAPVLGAASAPPAPLPAPSPVVRAVPLATRPDVAALFGMDVAQFRQRGAASLGRTASERFGGPVTIAPADVDVWAVPDRTAGSTGAGVIAVPAGAIVHADGSVSPPRRLGRHRPSSPFEPTFSSNWGDEFFFSWVHYGHRRGSPMCGTTLGEVRAQFEYARLPNVVAGSPWDYWGLAERSVAEVTRPSSNCQDAIHWFTQQAQSLSPGAYAARQEPLTGRTGKCETTTLTVGGTFNGLTASLQQHIERCEAWSIVGGLAPTARSWYGVEYANHGVWNQLQREAGAVEILRVPRGSDIGLNTKLGILLGLR